MKLPLVKLAWSTFAFPSMYPGAFARALSLPLLAVLALTMMSSVAGESIQGIQFVIYAIYLLAFSWLAIRCHRLVLTGSHHLDLPMPRALGMLGLFAVTTMLVWLLQTFVTLALSSGVIAVTGSRYIEAGAPAPAAFDPEIQAMIDRVMFFAGLVALYPMARLSPLFPAIALGEKWNAAGAWRLSRRNGWRLVVLVFLLPNLLTEFIQWAYPDDAGVVEFSISVLALAVVTSLGVVALSMSYRALTGELKAPGPPPTPPPG